MPFPGGVCRAGSKVGALVMQDIVATIDEAYCPTLRDQVETQLVDGRGGRLRNDHQWRRSGVGRRGDAGGDRGGRRAGGAGDRGAEFWRQTG